MTTLNKLRVGEIGSKIVVINGKRRKITMRRIKSTGFPQFIVMKNEKA